MSLTERHWALISKHNAMAVLLRDLQSETPRIDDFEARYVWLLRSSLAALGQPLAPHDASPAAQGDEKLPPKTPPKKAVQP